MATCKDSILRGQFISEEQANAVADALGGKAWQSGGDIWLVLLEKPKGKVVVISDDSVCEYADEEKFDSCIPENILFLH